MSDGTLDADSASANAPPAAFFGLNTWRAFYLLGTFACLLFVITLYFTPIAPIPIAGADDGHYLQQGLDISRGHWLGAYNHMTLVKGPGLPLFLAISNLLRLPYSISIALVEAGSFFLLCLVVGRLARAPGLALAMLITLLCFPWMWSGNGLRILRDGFYTALTFIFLALAFWTVWGDVTKRRTLGFAAGLVLGLASITREENPWFVPAVAILILALWVAERRRNGGLVSVAAIVLLGAIGVAGVRGVVLTLNYVNYKTFEITEFREKNFRDALRALYSIEPPERIPFLVASKEARAEAYKYSPTFSRLKVLLDGNPPTLEGWQAPGCPMYGGKVCGDYAGGWFLWAFRDAVTLVGAYADAATASEFYRQMAEEITLACEKKQITCRYSPIAEIPPLVEANFTLMRASLVNTVKLVTLATPMTAIRPRSAGPLEQVNASLDFLNHPIAAPHDTDPGSAIFSGNAPRAAVVFVQKEQNVVRSVFNAIWPFVCAIGVLGILFSTFVRRGTIARDTLMVMTWTFLTLVLARVGLLTIVDATVHPGATMDYGNVAAYCLVASVVMGLYAAAQDLWRWRERREAP